LTNQVILYILFISIILAGIGMALPNCLSLALVKFQEVAGTAGAFLSLGYYVIVSLCTFFIGVLHSGSMLVFPSFCLVLLLIALLCIKIATRNNR
ncbi:Bcr/CflA family drug resistance efflux transporter, partial [Listeria monocytogenes]|nr:Bcr/CflA family drug resistance efflux transporter [Listeria monocytogenes]